MTKRLIPLLSTLSLCVAIWIIAFNAVATVNDSDLDRIPDTIDVDDDNDGIPDSFEIAANGGDIDSDRDGMPNRLDLDSDNDGILDLEESGVFLYPGISAVRIVGGRLRTDVGANGFADLLETSQDSGLIAYQLLNSDGESGDTLPDYLDLDSDNDGLFDLIEAGVPASLDANRNGRIDAESWQVGADGILDTVQLNNDANCCDYDRDGVQDITPRNTDGSDFPDFQDIDSDNDGVFDLVEAGGRDLDADGRIDGFQDGSDEPDGVDDGIMLVPLTPPDNDSDGIPDYLDSDTQNDNLVQDSPAEVTAPIAPPEAPTTSPVPISPAPTSPLPSDTITLNPVPVTTINPIADDAIPDSANGPIATGLSGNGGCQLVKNGNFFDPLLPGLLFFAISYLYLRRNVIWQRVEPKLITRRN